MLHLFPYLQRYIIEVQLSYNAATVIVLLRCALAAIKGPNDVLQASIKFYLFCL